MKRPKVWALFLAPSTGLAGLALAPPPNLLLLPCQTPSPLATRAAFAAKGGVGWHSPRDATGSFGGHRCPFGCSAYFPRGRGRSLYLDGEGWLLGSEERKPRVRAAKDPAGKQEATLPPLSLSLSLAPPEGPILSPPGLPTREPRLYLPAQLDDALEPGFVPHEGAELRRAQRPEAQIYRRGPRAPIALHDVDGADGAAAPGGAGSCTCTCTAAADRQRAALAALKGAASAELPLFRLGRRVGAAESRRRRRRRRALIARAGQPPPLKGGEQTKGRGALLPGRQRERLSMCKVPSPSPRARDLGGGERKAAFCAVKIGRLSLGGCERVSPPLCAKLEGRPEPWRRECPAWCEVFSLFRFMYD